MRTLLAVCLLVVIAKSSGSSDDRFIKKYAMMKIYESCFGPEVVKQIRQEMKAACAKCSAPPVEVSANVPPTVLFGKLPPGFAMDPNTQTITRPNDGGASSEALENESAPDEVPQTLGGGKLSHSPFMDLRHQPFSQQPQPIPQQPPVGIPPYMFSPNGAAYRPYTAASPFYQYPYGGSNMLYPGSFGYNPYPSPYQQPQSFYQNPYFASQRMSRDMDLRDKIEMITSRTGGKMRNITCVMQELGYLDHNLEPNYEQITSRISNLPVSNELKEDIQQGLQFCQKFAQCVPEVKKDSSPLSRELIRPMFFFRCYKHKKLESCIMKDIRERFTSEDDIETETDFRSISRQGKSMKYPDGLNDPQIDALDEMAVYMYDFLSGGNSFDFDLYM